MPPKEQRDVNFVGGLKWEGSSKLNRHLDVLSTAGGLVVSWLEKVN